jgi:hypothetical protein
MTKAQVDKHIKDIIKLIPTKGIYCFSDVFVYYKAISRATAYNHGIDKIDDIKEAIYANKRKGVTSMLDKWIRGDNATLQIAAMRLISDDHERKALNQQYVDHTTGGDKMANSEEVKQKLDTALKILSRE